MNKYKNIIFIVFSISLGGCTATEWNAVLDGMNKAYGEVSSQSQSNTFNNYALVEGVATGAGSNIERKDNPDYMFCLISDLETFTSYYSSVFEFYPNKNQWDNREITKVENSYFASVQNIYKVVFNHSSAGCFFADKHSKMSEQRDAKILEDERRGMKVVKTAWRR